MLYKLHQPVQVMLCIFYQHKINFCSLMLLTCCFSSYCICVTSWFESKKCMNKLLLLSKNYSRKLTFPFILMPYLLSLASLKAWMLHVFSMGETAMTKYNSLAQWFLTFLCTRTPWAFIKFSRTPCLKASSNCYQRSSHGVTNSSAAV